MAAMVSSMFFGLGSGEFPESWSASRNSSKLTFSVEKLGGLDLDTASSLDDPEATTTPRPCDDSDPFSFNSSESLVRFFPPPVLAKPLAQAA
jgi:hypothetical protein